MNEPKHPDEQVAANERVPSYGLLVVNHAYNEGNITFLQWMKLSREWALKIIEQYDAGKRPSSRLPLYHL